MSETSIKFNTPAWFTLFRCGPTALPGLKYGESIFTVRAEQWNYNSIFILLKYTNILVAYKKAHTHFLRSQIEFSISTQV